MFPCFVREGSMALEILLCNVFLIYSCRPQHTKTSKTLPCFHLSIYGNTLKMVIKLNHFVPKSLEAISTTDMDHWPRGSRNKCMCFFDVFAQQLCEDVLLNSRKPFLQHLSSFNGHSWLYSFLGYSKHVFSSQSYNHDYCLNSASYANTSQQHP